MPQDPYAGDIFAGHSRHRAPSYPSVPAEPGLVVEVRGTDFVGEIVGGERTYDGDFVRLEDRHRRQRLFPLVPAGFLLEGEVVTLTRWVPPSATPQAPARSNSGSRRVANATPKVAAPSRIWVEGIHDAAIVQKVWGHDLAVEGVVVEHLSGLDHLPERLRKYHPGPGRRVGVLADHLIAGTKESRLTSEVGEHVLVTGHPYVDIWEAVKPASVGIEAWPAVPRGEDWKTGICRRLGWGTPRDGWACVYAAVTDFRDLDYTLIGAVERLVDFVTNPQLSKADAGA